jgi:hypothetical protein
MRVRQVDFSNHRPAYELFPTAVARHLTFRLDIDENPRWEPEPTERKARWKKLCTHLAKHINDLRAAYDPSGRLGRISFVGPDEPEQPYEHSVRAAILVLVTDDAQKWGYRLRVRVDVQTELFSLTYLFDRIDPAAAAADRLAQQIGLLPDEPEAGRWLLNDLWQCRAVPAVEMLRGWLDPDGNSETWEMGTLITDFRSLVLHVDDGSPMTGPFQGADSAGPASTPALDPKLAEFLERHRPLVDMIAGASEPETRLNSGGEAVVCGMLDGKALYVAQLGQWGKDVEPVQPIRHLLVHAGRCPDQLGRLVRRMHVLGELRHAAMLDYDPATPGDSEPKAGKGCLRDVSRRLRALGRTLNDVTLKVTAPAPPAGNGAAQPLKPPGGSSMAELKGIVHELAEISQLVEGSLTYRVEQSRYYAAEFARSIEHLRVVRVGDWQPYDDFVKRYILHLFARIHRIGNRFEALGRRVDRLLFYKQAELLDGYTDQVAATLADIRSGVAQMRDSARGQADATTGLRLSADAQKVASDRQVDLLRKAEAFAFVFLCYYVGSTGLKLVEAFHSEIAKTALISVWATATAVAVYNLVRHFRSARRRLSKPSSSNVADRKDGLPTESEIPPSAP